MGGIGGIGGSACNRLESLAVGWLAGWLPLHSYAQSIFLTETHAGLLASDTHTHRDSQTVRQTHSSKLDSARRSGSHIGWRAHYAHPVEITQSEQPGEKERNQRADTRNSIRQPHWIEFRAELDSGEEGMETVTSIVIVRHSLTQSVSHSVSQLRRDRQELRVSRILEGS